MSRDAQLNRGERQSQRSGHSTLHNQKESPPQLSPDQRSPQQNSSGPHVCWKCNAKFTRLDHLKRHIHSVYLSPKSHSCESCGKRFSRRSVYNVLSHPAFADLKSRDVLLRHHQSCRGAKLSLLERSQHNSSSTHTCQNCRTQNLDCSGGEKCLSCDSEGIDCVYTCGRRMSNHTRGSHCKEVLSPNMELLNGRSAGDSPRPRSSRHERPNGNSAVFEHVDALNAQVIRNEMDFENSTMQRDEWFGDDPGGDNFFDSSGVNRSKVSPSHSMYSTIPEMSQSVNGDTSQKHQKTGSKRGRYTSIAW